MFHNISSTIKLSNGVEIPVLGIGTWRSQQGSEVESAVRHALKIGYRHIDTAAIYGNELGVGKAIQDIGIHRKEIFVTTKVWNSSQGYESTLKAFEESRKKLNLEYIDLYLIHWPVKEKYGQTWKALEKLYEEGKVRAIGVSNFQVHHLKDLFSTCTITPMVNQVEYHPLLTQMELSSFCRQHHICLEAWSPLMQGHLELPLLEELARKYGKTKAQIVLRWDLQNGVITIPKSVKPERIEENAAIFDFELSHEDILLLNGLNSNRRFGPDPDNFNF